MISRLLFVLLFITPFLVFPIGVTPFETIKVLVSESILLACVGFFLWKTPTKNLLSFLSSQTLLTKLAFGGILVTILFSFLFFFTDTTLMGGPFRMQGVFLLLLLICLFFLSQKYSFSPFSFPVFVSLFVLQIVASLFISGRIDERAIGTLGEPNALAAFFVFLWPFVLFFQKQKKWLIIFLIFLSGGAILLTGSRSGLLAFSLQLLAFFLLLKISFKQTVVIILSLLALSYTLPFLETKSVYENRSTIWKVAFDTGFQSPVIGYGIGNIQHSLEPAARKLPEMKQITVDSSHNLFLDWFIQTGILGVIAFVILLFQAIRQQIFYKKKISFMILVGLLTCMSFNPVSVITLTALWYILGHSLTNKELLV